MATLVTVGREIYKDAVFQIHTSDEPALVDPGSPGEGPLFQLLYIQEGSVVVETAGGSKLLMPPLALCVNYQEPFDSLTIQNARGFSIVFRPEVINHSLTRFDAPFAADPSWAANRMLVNPFLGSHRDNPFWIAVDHPMALRLEGMFRNLNGQLCGQPDWNWPCRSRSFFLEILMLVHTLYGLKNPEGSELVIPADNPVLTRACTAMVLNYANPGLSPRTVARDCGLPVWQLWRLYRRHLGSSPGAYLAKVRTTVLANLLRNTILPVEALPERLGFRDRTAMERAFRRQAGLSCDSYRQAHPDPYHS